MYETRARSKTRKSADLFRMLARRRSLRRRVARRRARQLFVNIIDTDLSATQRATVARHTVQHIVVSVVRNEQGTTKKNVRIYVCHSLATECNVAVTRQRECNDRQSHRMLQNDEINEHNSHQK